MGAGAGADGDGTGEAGRRDVGNRPPEVLSARNRWSGTVLTLDSTPADAGAGANVIVTVGLAEGVQLTTPVTTAAAVELGLESGVAVDCLVKATAVTVHPRLTPEPGTDNV